jgi:hypothetical protein
MKTSFKYILFAIASIFLLIGCTQIEEYGTPRLFRPTYLTSVVGKTASDPIEFTFPIVQDAVGYVLRIGDKQDFSGTVQEIEIPQASVGYNAIKYTIFSGTTILFTSTDIYDFYVSVKAKNSNPEFDSKYTTPVAVSPYRENIFTNRKFNIINVLTDTLTRESLLKDQATFAWDLEKTTSASKIHITTPAGDFVKDVDITDPMTGTITADGLTPETHYYAFIYEGTTSRGRVKFKTTSANEVIVDNTDLATEIANAAPGAVLRLKPGTYTVTNLSIDKTIAITAFAEEKPIISMTNFILSGVGTQLRTSSVVIQGKIANSLVTFLNASTDASVHFFDTNIESCKNLVQYTADAIMRNLTIEQCIIGKGFSASPGAHFIDLRSCHIYNFTVKNSTIYNIVRGIIRSGTESNITTPITNQNFLITNNTFYGINADGSNYFIYTGRNTAGQSNTGSYTISNNIFDNVFKNSAAGRGFEMAGNCVLTNNNITNCTYDKLHIAPKKNWADSTREWADKANNNGEFDGSTQGIAPKFTDAANGDFSLPSNSALRTMAPGKLPIGDPRWAN